MTKKKSEQKKVTKKVTKKTIKKVAKKAVFYHVQKKVPEKPEDYPRCTMFGNVPAYGVYIRHAKGITLHKLDLDFQYDECRPAIMCDDVAGIDVSGLRAMNPQSDEPLIRLINAQDAFIYGFRPDDDLDLFLSVEGEKADRIHLAGNDFSKVNRIFKVRNGAVEKAVKLEGNILK